METKLTRAPYFEFKKAILEFANGQDFLLVVATQGPVFSDYDTAETVALLVEDLSSGAFSRGAWGTDPVEPGVAILTHENASPQALCDAFNLAVSADQTAVAVLVLESYSRYRSATFYLKDCGNTPAGHLEFGHGICRVCDLDTADTDGDPRGVKGWTRANGVLYLAQ